MKRIRTVPLFCFFTLISLLFFIQQGRAQDLQMAVSSPSYQVTAGDVYSLTYAGGTHVIIVDYTYRIVIPDLGIVSGAGKTYQQLKREIEAIVTNNYPRSGAHLSLTSPSSFRVYVNGEVNSIGERSTWAMGRLSSLIYGNLTAQSSNRNITVTSANGQVKTYDLLRAERFGDLTQNPYLRPEDLITVNRIDRLVSISGEIVRPESYELLPEENLRDLITNYAGGYTAAADTGRIEITRYTENDREVYNRIRLNQDDVNANYPLQDFDVIYIPPK
jgi:protein involved in polysaccharide export with SLBB domain